MLKLKYKGQILWLQNQTALGRMEGKLLFVQVDKFTHCWSHGWHNTAKRDWEILK